MTSRLSRRRGRKAAPPPDSPAAAPAPPSEEQQASEQHSSGYGRLTLVLALLLGTLIERAALHLQGDARDIFHFLVLLGIALIAAGVYRRFARGAVERSRQRRRQK